MAKYKIIPSSRTIVQSPISIGHKAEKGVEAIEFDLTAWVETYGSGTLTVIMRRWGDAIPYPIALEIDENNKATWVLSDTDTAKAGMAYAQLSYIVGDEVVKKSDIYTFRVMDSLTGEGEPPEAYESWLEHLTHLAAEAMAEVLDIEGIVTDKTLTVDGGIADGKATGDALALKADKSTTYTKSEIDTLIESVDVETDTTLSVSGKPADSKTVGDELSDIKADLGDVDDILDIKTIEYADGYIKAVDATVDISTIYPSDEIEHSVVPMVEKQNVVVNGTGSVIWRAWYFADANYNRLSYSVANLECDNLVLSAPANTAFLILNRRKGRNKKSYIGVPTSRQCAQLIAQGIDKASRCSYFLDYDGRIDSNGITVMPSNSNIQRYSDYIPVTAGENIVMELCVPYVENRTTWLAYSVYDSNKDVVIGRRHITANTISNGYMYSIAEYTVTADGYIRIMGDTFGDGVFAFYATSNTDEIQMPRQRFKKEIIEVSVEKATDISAQGLALKADKSTTYTKSEVDQIINDIPSAEIETDTIIQLIADGFEKSSRCSYFLDYDGRIDSNGITIYGSATVDGIPCIQRYSDYIPVTAGENIVMELCVPYVENRTTWLAYSVYDSNKDVVIGRRHTNANTTSNGYMYSIQKYTPTVDGYIRVTGNTYGEGIFAVYVSGDADSVQIPRQKIKKEIVNVSVEKAIKEAIPLMRYYTRYDDVCIGVNHRGYNTAPENTIPAYIESYKHGFRYVECDVKLTSDGEFVLLHDATINRTARNADGTTISETTNITDITYEQALEFDFGIYKSSEYAGTKIPLLSEFLLFCRKVGLHPYLELKFAYTEATTKAVVDIVRAHGMSGKVTYISASGNFLRTINAYEPTARLGIITELPTSGAVDLAVELKNDSNFVFIDADRATDEAVGICKQSNIPMEVWIVTANKNVILSTNPYITGFSHDYLHAGKVMYEDIMGEA